jgi:uncharacterized membrane protein YgdD (TMEM256/DUF423 family)
MTGTAKLFVACGAVAGALGVLLGAFGAHAMKSRLSADLLAIWQTAVQYHLWHALALVAIGLAAISLPASVPLRWAGWLMLAGVAIFSGTLYLLALTGARWLGAITPIGGTAMIVAWLLFAWAVVRG